MNKYPLNVPGVKPNTFHIGAYCSPQPADSRGDIEYPSKITLEQYKRLADLGVTVVYGHAEAIGRFTEPYVFEALRLCEQVGIQYLVRDLIAEEYVSLGFREYKDWRKLTPAERQDLDERFKKSILRYKDYPAFAGISFYDEPGLDSFEGIAAAKKVFKSVCPDKLFYVNMLPDNCASAILQYGACQIGVPESDDPNLAVPLGNESRYHYFLKKYMDTVSPDLYSYDSYPFVSLGGHESIIVIAMYELLQQCAWAEREYGVPFWPFLQVGGMWENSLDTRVTDYAEMCLYANIALAYGAKGLQLFPTCYPNDWLSDRVARAGVIDKFGNETEHYHYLKVIFRQVKACGDLLVRAQPKASVVCGKYEGLLPPEEELQKIPWNEAIFRGRLPQQNSNFVQSWRELVSAEATSQFFIGCFEYEGRSLFYAVNNSITAAANLKLKFSAAHEYTVIRGGIEETLSGDTLFFQRVAAGDGILILIK